MRKLACFIILSAAVLAAQAPPVRTYPDVTTAQTNASIALLGYKSNLESFVSQDGIDIWNLQQVVGASKTGLLDRMTAAETTLKNLPPPVSGPSVEYMLVIPFGSTGFSIASLGPLAEYPPVQRTRRVIDFSNVHQLRLCDNIISPASAGSFFQLEQSGDLSTWAVISGQVGIVGAGLSCTPWTNYTGSANDQFVRISIAGSGSVTLDYISVQLR